MILNKNDYYKYVIVMLNDGNGFNTTQGVVHSIDGDKRKYHLE